MNMQNKQSAPFSSKVFLSFFHIGKRGLDFFFRPLFIQMKDPTYIGWSEEANAKLPGLPTLLRVYENRCIAAGMIASLGGLTIMGYVYRVWPFLLGLAINAIFIMILLRYRSQFSVQYPIVAREFTKYTKWLVFYEVLAILAFFLLDVCYATISTFLITGV